MNGSLPKTLEELLERDWLEGMLGEHLARTMALARVRDYAGALCETESAKTKLNQLAALESPSKTGKTSP